MKAVTAIQRNSNHKIHSIRQILIPVILVLLFGMILYKCNQFTKEPLTSTAGQTYERATVTAVTRDNLAEDGNRYGNQQVTVRINSGTYKGKSFSATSPSGQLFGATCKPGMHVIVILSASSGTQVATVYSQNRIPAILAFIGIFTAAVCLIGGRKGIMSIFGLVFAFTAILYLMFPAIYQGASPHPHGSPGVRTDYCRHTGSAERILAENLVCHVGNFLRRGCGRYRCRALWSCSRHFRL